MKGMTPGVVYGAGGEAIKLQLDTKILMAQLLEFYRKNTVVTLDVEGVGEKKVLFGEVQTDPVRDTLIHIDFCEIDLEKKRAFSVPVVYKGKAKGVDLGGVMVVNHEELTLEGKPLDIPDECEVDVRGLAIGDRIRCSKIQVPENVTMLTPGKDLAVSIVKPGQKIEDDADEAEVAEAV
jgi:large subunit ribosomal protein L25